MATLIAVKDADRSHVEAADIFTLGIRIGRMSAPGRGGCILWTGGTNPKGYGGVHFRGKWRAVHQLAYLIAVGPVPKGLELDHVCRNRDCINPEHLEPVTHAENMRRQSRPFGGVCRNGHVRTAENTRDHGANGRRCLDCDRESARRKHAKRRAARAAAS